MRYKFYSILYLTVTLFYLLRPSLPYIEYVINRNYIEKNLCVEKANPENTCHGKCHLHEQINKQSDPIDEGINDDSKIIPVNKMDDHLQAITIFPGLFETDSSLSSHYSVSGTIRFISNIFIPPKY